MNVRCVDSISVGAVKLPDIRYAILVRSPMAVRTVGKAFVADQVLSNMKESTLVEKLTNAKNVGRPLAMAVASTPANPHWWKPFECEVYAVFPVCG